MPLSLDRELNDVLIFLQVVDSGSFTAAAKSLKLPTSTVSRRVSRLEDQLGVRLLQRTTRKLSVTEAGELYHARGREFFAQLEDTENILADAQANPRGRVRVTAPLEQELSMRLVWSFMERYPEVRVDMELSNRGINIIEEGFDVAITAGTLTNLSVVAHRLIDSDFCIVATPDYLERQGTPNTMEDLNEHTCVIFGTNSSSATWTLKGPEGPQAVEVRGRIAVNHLAGVRQAVIAHMGIGLMPKLSCADLLRSGQLIELLAEHAPDPIPVWVSYPSGRFLAPAVRAFVDHVREHFADIVQADA